MTENSPEIRVERDSLGEVEVESSCYWGAQTQRSLTYFSIGGEQYKWQRPFIRALGLLKQAAAQANIDIGMLDKAIGEAIIHAAEEVIDGKLDAHFPLGVFQTGSGTHSNMNANEVIANRAIEMLGGTIGSKTPVHPNDHVNLCQSSNDVFPSAIHVAVLELFQKRLLPQLGNLINTLDEKVQAYKHIVKTGRTHLQDAAPLTLGQEISAWVEQLKFGKQCLQEKQLSLYALAIGGTAVGTGLNSHADFGEKVAEHLEKNCGIPFSSAPNKFFALSAHDPLVEFSASLRTLSGALLKIANDIRWLASGPRCGIGELNLPQNEPGSSIMPGKVNPTQCEALSMVCVQVFGNDAAVAFAGSQGNFQLNAYKPVILHNTMQSLVLLADACHSFERWCVAGLEPNREKIDYYLERNLMLVTALNKHIGYDKAAEIAKLAEKNNITLKQAALELHYATAEEFDKWVVAIEMVGNAL